MQTFIDVEQARALILKTIQPLGAQRLALELALGRVLAVDVEAPQDWPPFDQAAMDGFAARSAELTQAQPQAPVTLRVIEHLPAGAVPQRHVAPGQCARIMTGAMMPSGADTVIKREDCHQEGDERVQVLAAPSHPGEHVRHRGAFMHQGQLILQRGERLEPGDLAVLASFGMAVVQVFAQPRVAILCTGDELVELGQRPGPGQIINSNATMLDALVRRCGAIPITLPNIPDRPEALLSAYGEAMRVADLVISSGGASVGDHDHVTPVLRQLCDGLDLWKIRMKPGKPLVFGRARDSQLPLIGLPGNPVSSLVCFHQFVRPALQALQGVPSTQLTLRRLRATLTRDVPSTAQRRHYITGRLLTHPQGLRFDPIDQQDSGNLRVLCQIDALGILDEGVAHLGAGQELDVELL